MSIVYDYQDVGKRYRKLTDPWIPTEESEPPICIVLVGHQCRHFCFRYVVGQVDKPCPNFMPNELAW
jgi:hypothetical protein